jgi:quercetin dioxygenase-like cupin family protein
MIVATHAAHRRRCVEDDRNRPGRRAGDLTISKDQWMHQLKPVNPTAKGPAQRFTGDVYITPIVTGEPPSRMTVALVRFTPGARTNWHSHAVGQTLHVTEGVGLVGTRDGTVLRIRAGNTVVCPPDEDHWHGAAADTFMSHLAMLEAGPDGSDPTTWLEAVPENEYDKADQQP